jgi:hypothetical protein
MGVWEARDKLENKLRGQLKELSREREQFGRDKRALKAEMQNRVRHTRKTALAEGKLKEKARADKLSKMLERRASVIEGLNKEVGELREQLRRGTTPQIEGLNLETELVRELSREFPEDGIEHHGKAGDIVQRVMLRRKQVGVIVFECKRTLKFSASFIRQTKDAMRSWAATYGVLVTTAFKKGTAGFMVADGVMVVHPFGAVHIAGVLRHSLIELNSQRASVLELNERTKLMMRYIQSDEFKSSVEDSIHRTRLLAESLVKEKKSHEGVWREREANYVSIYVDIGRLKQATTHILTGGSHGKADEQSRLPLMPGFNSDSEKKTDGSPASR